MNLKLYNGLMLLRNQKRGASSRARALRSNMSESERRLWKVLRKGRIGFHVRRQHPIGPYTLDFFILEAMLCIEVDGELHVREKDEARDLYLKEMGVETIRIPSMSLPKSLEYWQREICRQAVLRSGRDPFSDVSK